MEVLTQRAENREAAARQVASVIEGQVIEIVPVPYAGDEQVITVVRQPVNKFMLEIPA